MAEFSVTTTCKTCGSVPLDPSRIRLHLRDEPISYFSCTCPACHDLLGGTVGTQVAMGLASRGAEVSELPFSPELLERPHCDPLTEDEVMEFHYLLEGDDWFGLLRHTPKAGDIEGG